MLINLLIFFLIISCFAVGLLASKHMQYWFPHFLVKKLEKQEILGENTVVDIILCIVDHFEPGHGEADIHHQEQRIATWTREYPKLADAYRDADGVVPQHTWFYPPHHNLRFLPQLVDLCKRGYGEIEMHLHHNRMEPFPDTPETLRAKITKCIDDYSRHGIFCLRDGSRRFAFIHGDWSLDNSRGNEFCGVNNELRILKECGCYADFTFPGFGKSQPAMANTIYYAQDDPLQPKSYNWGKEVTVNGTPWGDLMLIPGIIGIRRDPSNGNFNFLIEQSNIDRGDEPSQQRIDYWVMNAPAVQGRPEWKFIKLHMHGAPDSAWNSAFGSSAENMFTYLQQKYNDGSRFRLHYVTARKMYNIIKAAEAGKQGNAGEYRNFEIPAYVYL